MKQICAQTVTTFSNLMHDIPKFKLGLPLHDKKERKKHKSNSEDIGDTSLSDGESNAKMAKVPKPITTVGPSSTGLVRPVSHSSGSKKRFINR